MARSWLVRLGKCGEREAHALETGELVTNWRVDDLSGAAGRPEILAKIQASNPDEKPGTLQNWAVQLNQLARDVAEGDLVVLPLKTTGQVAIGRVKGGYWHSPDNHPARRVEWLRTDLPRSAIRQDLLS